MNSLLLDDLQKLLNRYERDAQKLHKVLLEFVPSSTVTEALQRIDEREAVLKEMGLDMDISNAISYLVVLDNAKWALRIWIKNH